MKFHHLNTDTLTRPFRWLSILAAACFLLACDKNDGKTDTDPKPDPGTENKHEVVVLDQKERPAVEEIKSDGTVVFSGTDFAKKVAPGTVICSEPAENAPRGFLYKVKSVKTEGGKTIVTTEQACLEDAIEECHVVESLDLTDKIELIEFGDGTIAKPIYTNTKAEVSTSVKLPFTIKAKDSKIYFQSKPEDLEIIETDPNDENIEVIELVGDDIVGKGSIAAEIGVSLEFKATFGIELDVAHWSVEHFALWVQPEIKVESEAAFVLEGKAEFKEIKIAKIHMASFTIWAGIIPVVITPSIGLYADVTASGKLKFKTKLIDLDYKYKFGIDYSNDDWNMISENTSKEPSFFKLSKNLKATLEGDLEITPVKVTIIPGLYNVDAEGNFYAGASMPFKISVTDFDLGYLFSEGYINPKIKGTWSIVPEAKAKLTVLKHELIDKNPKFTLLSITLFEKTFFPKMTDLTLTGSSSTFINASFSLTDLRSSFFRRFGSIGICYSEVNGSDQSLQAFGDGNYNATIGGDGLYWDSEDSEEDIDVSLMIQNLKPNTHYYMRPFFNTILGTKYGKIIEATTSGDIKVQTLPVTDITATTATLNGNFETGGLPILERGYCVSSTNSVPTREEDEFPVCLAPAGSSSFSIQGLMPMTKYYVRAFATNELGTVYGNVVDFTTAYGEGPTNISVTPAVIDFESVEYGTDKTGDFTVTNTGRNPLIFQLTYECHDNVFEVNDGGGSITVAPGASKVLTVTAHGMKRNSSASCDIRILSNADNGTQSVHVKSVGWDNKPLTLETTFKTVVLGKMESVDILFGSSDYEVTSENPDIVRADIGVKNDSHSGRYDQWSCTSKYVTIEALASGTATLKVRDRERNEQETLTVRVVGATTAPTKIMVTTTKPIGSSVSFDFSYKQNEELFYWFDTNNNDILDEDEKSGRINNNYDSGIRVDVPIKSSSFALYIKNVSYLDSRKNELSSLDFSEFDDNAYPVKLETLYLTEESLEELTLPEWSNLSIIQNGASSASRFMVSGNSVKSITLYPLYNSLPSRITSLDVTRCPNLESLVCETYSNIEGNCYLTALDLSNNRRLTYLNCAENRIERLDLSNCPDLESVFCYSNSLTSLVFNQCTRLKVLECGDNKLTTLQMPYCPNLESLTCHDNNLHSLNVSQCNRLDFLACRDNPSLRSIDLSNSPLLETFIGVSCNFDELDFSRNPQLTTILCDGNSLTSLDLSNNPRLACLGINYNKMDAEALNSIYRQVPDISGQNENNDIYWPLMFKMLRANGNPGYLDSDRSIAEAKGWEFEDKWGYYQAKRPAKGLNKTRVLISASGRK